MQDQFKYEVAFSFCQPDEGLAFQFYNLLNTMSCFIYSKEQQRLGGKNGETVFNDVFAKEARIVVVLFREEWGHTKWTRVEETAIRNRGFEEGYDFVLLIPTQNNIDPPKWLPKNRIWIGLERWGIESAAAIIEARVQESGGEIKAESISDKVARIERELKEKQQREQILEYEAGLKLAQNELKVISSEVNRLEREIKSKTSDWVIKIRENSHNRWRCDVMCYGYYLTFQFYQQYQNTLTDAYLLIGLWKGYFDERGNQTGPSYDYKQIADTRLRFDINVFNQNGWSLKDSGEEFQSSSQVVENWFNELITYAGEGKQNRY